MSYSEIYFAVASVSTIIVAGLLLLALIYILAILRDVKKLSKLAKKEAEFIANSFAKGASILGSELSGETAGFVRTLFTLLISQFVKPKNSRSKKQKALNP
ncbi:MAG: hypothetical protein M1338_02375 [Patescibacteria group bacterium]|nr:hypothetical protein [Patescibacteria group bacterium]